MYLSSPLRNHFKINHASKEIPWSDTIFNGRSVTSVSRTSDPLSSIYISGDCTPILSWSKSEAKNMAAAWRKTRLLTSQSTYFLVIYHWPQQATAILEFSLPPVLRHNFLIKICEQKLFKQNMFKHVLLFKNLRCYIFACALLFVL